MKNTKVKVTTESPPVDKKTAIYIRVSTDAQAEEGYSIPAQTEKLTALCVSKGWKDPELFVDPGYSGSNLDRPEMQRMIREIGEGKISTVVVYKLDRLSRSQKDTMALIEDVFLPAGVTFVSLNESFDTATPYGRAMLGILSSFAQLERENIKMRTRMGMMERVKRGYWPGGGKIPFGYDYDSDQGILVPNEKEAPIVKQIYDLYIQGNSAQHIANILGLKYEKLAVQILTRISNTGMISYNGEVYQGLHQPIISTETYEKAMSIMQERSLSKMRPTGNTIHLLSGIIYCGECGARLRYLKWGKKGYKLCCYSKMKDKEYMQHDPDCRYKPVWAEEVEQAIIDDLFNLSVYMGNQKDGVGGIIDDPVTKLEKQIKKQESKLRRLYSMYANNEDNEQEPVLLESIHEVKQTLKELKSDLEIEEEAHVKQKRSSLILNDLARIKDFWERFTFQQKQMIIRETVEKIVVYNAGDTPEVEVFYRFTVKDGEEGASVLSKKAM